MTVVHTTPEFDGWIKELERRSPLRILYAFDPRREALVLLGGDKGAEPRFYPRIIERAEALWAEHLGSIASEETP